LPNPQEQRDLLPKDPKECETESTLTHQ
jgi:hypothetical protein